MKKRTMLFALAVAAVAAACGGSNGDVPSPTTTGSSGSSGSVGSGEITESTGSSGSSVGSTVGSSGSSGSSSGAGKDASTGGTGGVAAACNGDEGGAVPTTPAALQGWLGKQGYKCWTHESVRHPSTGPHHGEVQTYLNAKLDASMKAGGEHPEGSVAVKEFYDVGGTAIVGWAVSVKTQASSSAGQGYYWYESFGAGPGASNLEGQGKGLCVSCHAAGNDFILIPYPLR